MGLENSEFQQNLPSDDSQVVVSGQGWDDAVEAKNAEQESWLEDDDIEEWD